MSVVNKNFLNLYSCVEFGPTERCQHFRFLRCWWDTHTHKFKVGEVCVMEIHSFTHLLCHFGFFSEQITYLCTVVNLTPFGCFLGAMIQILIKGISILAVRCVYAVRHKCADMNLAVSRTEVCIRTA